MHPTKFQEVMNQESQMDKIYKRNEKCWEQNNNIKKWIMSLSIKSAIEW